MKKKTQEKQLFPKIVLDSRNFFIFIAGLVVLVVGYILLSVAPWDNVISRSVAPIVLLVGYLVLFPMAIFYQARTKAGDGSSEDDS